METRMANLIIGTPGGTASRNSQTYKLSLPSAWVREMGLSKEAHQLLLSFDGTQIVVSRRPSFQEFWDAAAAQRHHLLHISLLEGNSLCGEMLVDDTAQTVCVQNHTADILKTPFGNNLTPSWEDYREFLQTRCIPQSRAGLREYLEALGLDHYDPLAIIRKTRGRMAEDALWLKVEEIL